MPVKSLSAPPGYLIKTLTSFKFSSTTVALKETIIFVVSSPSFPVIVKSEIA